MLAALLFAASSACGAHAPPPLDAIHASPDLAVISWNVHAGRGDLPRLVDDLTHGRLIGVPVAHVVILLQETIAGGEHDVTAFGRERQWWSYFAAVRESSRGTSGNAILTTERPLAVRTVVLPRIRRVRKAVTATFEVAGHQLFVANAHLENRLSWLKGGFFADGARRRQTEALLEALPAGPGIVGGDLNTVLGPDEPAWRMLTTRFSDTPAAMSPPTFRDRLVLDHLFFDLPEGWTVTRRVLPNRYGSDHHPVLGLVYARGRLS